MLDNIMWGLFVLLALIGVVVAAFAVADWIIKLVVRVFPFVGAWLDSLPLSH